MAGERALLIAIDLDLRFDPKGQAHWRLADEMDELRELVRSSGCQVMGEIEARRHRPVAGTFLGSGKLEEIAAKAEETGSQVAIFNQELSPAQQRNIEEAVGVKSIDRTQLILDIFAQRAKSQEGKIQVELAQLRYLLPRLVGKGVMLSRLGGGIGTRGPGEQKLEVDRRRVRQRIQRLQDELKKLSRRREAARARRRGTETATVALIGYTNAGKTTLLNRLTGEASTTRNQLFTTLDPLARRLKLPGGAHVIITDTVGFLHHLPHHLVEAFKATLEEAADAALLLHVLDVSHPLASSHAEAVEEVLKSLGLERIRCLTALNKVDQLSDRTGLQVLARTYSPAAPISAKTGEGLHALLTAMEDELAPKFGEPMTLQVPMSEGGLLAWLYRSGEVIRSTEHDGTFEVLVRLPPHHSARVAQYVQQT